jgi:hypothetical protein
MEKTYGEEISGIGATIKARDHNPQVDRAAALMGLAPVAQLRKLCYKGP